MDSSQEQDRKKSSPLQLNSAAQLMHKNNHVNHADCKPK
uniref:Uncharacterized protein n=1 Tax=Arundo donax TaxID=35708 RepID=A0A0A9BR78_ARUDO